MRYSDLYQSLKTNFPLVNKNTSFVNNETTIRLIPFSSAFSTTTYENEILPELRKEQGIDNPDSNILENNNFLYPVFIPKNRKINNKVIILLHGLNERNWYKYLPWACYLAEKTQRPVIAFPISFHINRAPESWAARNVMSVLAEQRKNQYKDNHQTSNFINYALSNRLTEKPERFLISGLQTVNDLVTLTDSINNGKHPLFVPGTECDFFSYSIGGFISQILVFSNPSGLFDNSKHFLFCSGCLLEDMNGVSRSILDNTAGNRLKTFYLRELPQLIKNPGVIRDFFMQSKIAEAFRIMLSGDKYSNIRRKVFSGKQHQVFMYSLLKDTVMPYSRLTKTLVTGTSKLPANVEIDNFMYPYTHEVPFPVVNKNITGLVDNAFKKVMSRAVEFFS